MLAEHAQKMHQGGTGSFLPKTNSVKIVHCYQSETFSITKEEKKAGKGKQKKK